MMNFDDEPILGLTRKVIKYLKISFLAYLSIKLLDS
jgi:hypothetical protein